MLVTLESQSFLYASPLCPAPVHPPCFLTLQLCCLHQVYHRVVLRRALASFPSAGLHVLDRISTLMKEYPAQVDVESSIQLRDEVLQTLETEVEESTLHSILTDYLPRQEFLPDIIRLSEPSPRKRVVHLRKEVLLHATDPLFECDEDHRNVAHTILDCLLQVRQFIILYLVC